MATKYSGEVYGGLIPALKGKYVNLDLLFNTKRKQPKKKTAFKVSLASGTINQGAGAIGTCGDIPVKCTGYEKFEIEATEPFTVNNVYDQCLEDISNEDIMQDLNIISREWGEGEATYAYSKILAAPITDATAAALATTSAKEKVQETIKPLLEEGYSLRDILVCVSDQMVFDLDKEDMACCDWNIANSETGSILKNKLKVIGIVNVPTAVLSGGAVETAEEEVSVLAYVKELVMFLTFCETQPKVRNISPENRVESTMQIIGQEYAGVGIYDNKAVSVCYAAAPAGV